MSGTPKQVVILGGGFAGVRAAQDLGRAALSGGDLTVLLVTDRPSHEYHASFYEAASTDWRDGSARAVARTTTFSYDEVFAKLPVEIRYATVRSIDLAHRSVKTEQGIIPYDILIVALGSVTNYYHIPGLEEHSIPLKILRDALHIRQRVGEELRRPQAESVSIVVGGGGLTGVELAAELVGMVQRVAWRLHNNSRHAQITIIEGCDQLMPGQPLSIARTVQQRLHELEVKVLLGLTVTQVRKNELVVRDEQGERTIPYDVFVWAGGIIAPPLVARADWAKNNRGQVLVEPDLTVARWPGVFVIGDAAAVIESTTGKPVPATAAAAVEQARLAAQNVGRLFKHQKLQAYRPRRTRVLIPLGGWYAVAEYRHWRLVGLLGWLVRRAVDWHYFRSILSWHRAWQVWWSGTMLYRQNDPRPE